MKRKGFLLTIIVLAVAAAGFAVGRISGDQSVLPDRVKRVFPSLPPPPSDSAGDSSVQQSPVIIEVPAENATVSGGFEVAGRFLNDGRVPEVALKDSNGHQLYEVAAQVLNGQSGEYARFKATIPGPVGVSGNLVIEVSSRHADGSLTGPDAVRIVQQPVTNLVKANVFFGNDTLDPVISCSRTYPVSRQLEVSGSVYEATIESLLKGPTESESQSGYSTAIPKNTMLNSVTIDSQGQVTADFGGGIAKGAAGSCLVTAIRSQIEQTLLQFAGVEKVVISVDGEVEEALQP